MHQPSNTPFTHYAKFANFPIINAAIYVLFFQPPSTLYSEPPYSPLTMLNGGGYAAFRGYIISAIWERGGLVAKFKTVRGGIFFFVMISIAIFFAILKKVVEFFAFFYYNIMKGS